MYKREKIVLSLLHQIAEPVSRTVLVKLVFLLRNETALENMAGFYDFVPYKYGPFSFTLYRDLSRLRQKGFVEMQGEGESHGRYTLTQSTFAIEGLTDATNSAVSRIVAKYGPLVQKALIKDVYCRYPWFALKSELPERKFASLSPPIECTPAVYTSGYEGKSVEAFFNRLLKQGIGVVIDVRANPVSRKYGFSKMRLSQFCERLGLSYRHEPSLGIASSARSELGDLASYQRLFGQYELELLAKHAAKLKQVGIFMSQAPAVLVCLEKDVRYCHRKVLADAIAISSGLEVIHL